jgi:hypothetical protein
MIVILIAMTLSLLIAVMTAAAALGILKNNGAVGIRTTATMRSEKAWLRAHIRALPTTVATAAIIVIIGVALLSIGLTDEELETAGGILTGLTIVGLVGAAVIAHRAAKGDAS